MTTNTYYATPDSLETEMLEDINKIELKNGTTIMGKDKMLQLGKNADSTTYLIIWSDEQYNSNVKEDNSTANWSKKVISGNDIKKIQLNDSHVNVPVTIPLILGILVVLTAIGIGTSMKFGGSSPAIK